MTDRKWFQQAFGFEEGDYAWTRNHVMKPENYRERVQPDPLGDRPSVEFRRAEGENDWLVAGHFETPTVHDLRTRAQRAIALAQRMGVWPDSVHVRVSNVCGDSRQLHQQPTLTGAVFQAASQFNCLEFSSPSVTPESGLTQYCDDKTQGPACAMTCAAGLLFRQYGVQFGDSPGQTKQRQLNTLQDVEAFLTKSLQCPVPWKVANGYIEAESSLSNWSERLSPLLLSEAIGHLRVGVQWDTEVTTIHQPQSSVLVTQVYASAVSVGYSKLDADAWKPIARLVLDGAYEASVLVAIINNARRLMMGKPTRPLLLTKLGGGVFQNETSWIVSAISRGIAVAKSMPTPLDVQIVHYKKIESEYADIS